MLSLVEASCSGFFGGMVVVVEWKDLVLVAGFSLPFDLEAK